MADRSRHRCVVVVMDRRCRGGQREDRYGYL